MVELDLGRAESAQRYLRESLDSNIDAFSADQRSDALRLLARARGTPAASGGT